MSKMVIPPEIKAQADKIVAEFNRTVLKDQPHRWFSTRYRGQYLYLDTPKTYRTWPVCRLGGGSRFTNIAMNALIPTNGCSPGLGLSMALLKGP